MLLKPADQHYHRIVQAFSLECVTKNNFLISQPKHMLWVLKRTSDEHTKHILKMMGKNTLNFFVYLNLCYLVKLLCMLCLFLRPNMVILD